jgi:hypothetical protein
MGCENLKNLSVSDLTALNYITIIGVNVRGGNIPSNLSQYITVLTCISKVSILNLNQNTDYSYQSFSFFSDPSGECCDS